MESGIGVEFFMQASFVHPSQAGCLLNFRSKLHVAKLYTGKGQANRHGAQACDLCRSVPVRWTFFGIFNHCTEQNFQTPCPAGDTERRGPGPERRMFLLWLELCCFPVMAKRRKHQAAAGESRAVRWLRALSLPVKIILGVVIALLIFRLFLPGIVKNYVNKKLNELPGYSGHVEDIDISLYRGAYVIKWLLLKKKTDPEKYPFLKIARADLSLQWGALFHGRLVGKVLLDEPVMHILATEKT